MSPTVELSCAMAMANLSAGRAFMEKLYRLAARSGNGGLCNAAKPARSERSKAIAALHKNPVNIGLEIERLRETAEILKMRVAPTLPMPITTADPNAHGVAPRSEEHTSE